MPHLLQIEKRPKSSLLLLSSLFFILFNACTPKRNPQASFYYWKSVFRLSPTEKESLSQLQVKRLYVKFFDVDWDYETGQARPVAEIQFSEKMPKTLAVVPVVFITNRTLLEMPERQLPDLANKITDKISSIVQTQQIFPTEIQLDCDWSKQSRDKFFKIVSFIKVKPAYRNIQLSVTIRLHQLKYPGRTGVPPADKGVLMFYNMGRLDGGNTDNSILDLKIARTYLRRLKGYPLPLDVALPVYGWAVLKREGRVVNLLNNVPADSLTDTTLYEQLAEKKIRVKQSHYLHSVYLYPGDQLRLEDVSLTQLQESADLLKPIVNQPKPKIIFYSLDEKNLTRYPPQTLENVVRRFR